MAKDPRFNFYPDNYMGGTIGFTLEQHGAYLQLLILNSKLGKFTESQALDHLNSLTRGNTAVSTELWRFLIHKFEREGQFFFSGRLLKEMEKSKRHSEKQSERVKTRWNKGKEEKETQSGTDNGNTAVLPVNRNGNGNGNGNEEKGVQGETDFSDYERWTLDAITGNDPFFTSMLRTLKYPPRDQMPDLARSHLALLAKYPKMKPSDQNRFRISLIDHIAKELKNATQNRNTKSPLSSASVITTGKDFGDF